MGNIYFIRHGQASFGERNYDSLCENGRLQSRILGEYLAGLGLSFDSAYSGEMERQKQTAAGVLSAFNDRKLPFPEIQVLSDLNEFDFSNIVKMFLPDIIRDDVSFQKDVDVMFKERRSFQRIIDTVMTRWISGIYDKPGMLGWKTFKERIVRATDRIISENGGGKTVIVFSSGGPISAVVQMALGISDEMTAKLCWQVNNASVTRFIYNSDIITMSGFNNISHLEMKGDRGLITYR